jgi:ferrous iron transport protein B
MTDRSLLRIALIGSPNTGKTALFNRLTGLRQKVANYSGVTVDYKEGRLTIPQGRRICVLDLPGTYGTDATSHDENIALSIIHGQHPTEPKPEAIIFVLNATNLRLHLRLLLEIRRLGLPMIVALNMVDQAQRHGIHIDVPTLSRRLGMPVIETVAIHRDGVKNLLKALDSPPTPYPIQHGDVALHTEIRSILDETVQQPISTRSFDDRLDRWVLHPTIGLIVLALVMSMTFQAVYALGKPITDGVVSSMQWLGETLTAALNPGPLTSLIQEGIFGGLGTLLGFLPQILILFFCILVLEQSGYLPRAAFLLDRCMQSVGLSGRAFIPLLSSFACAIPSIMSARSIPDRRDRLVTILVAPLMTCSARLPVYALLIGAFIPDQPVMGTFNLRGIVLFALYLGGIVAAMFVAYVAKYAHRQQPDTPLLMEIPPYRTPHWPDIAMELWEKSRIFLKRLTGIMLALTVTMWAICQFPSAPLHATQPAIEYSLAGTLGQWLQPLFAPLGFDWRITLALIPAFAAREAAVATLATIYNVSAGQDEALGSLFAHQTSIATALALMAWFAFAPQCMSTLAIIKRETASWKMVWLSFIYMFTLAYATAWATYQLAVRYL